MTAAAPAPTQSLGSDETASGAYDCVVVAVVVVVVVPVVVVVSVLLARAEVTPRTAPRTPRTRSQTPYRIGRVCRSSRPAAQYLWVIRPAMLWTMSVSVS